MLFAHFYRAVTPTARPRARAHTRALALTPGHTGLYAAEPMRGLLQPAVDMLCGPADGVGGGVDPQQVVGAVGVEPEQAVGVLAVGEAEGVPQWPRGLVLHVR